MRVRLGLGKSVEAVGQVAMGNLGDNCDQLRIVEPVCTGLSQFVIAQLPARFREPTNQPLEICRAVGPVQ